VIPDGAQDLFVGDSLVPLVGHALVWLRHGKVISILQESIMWWFVALKLLLRRNLLVTGV
jgi:hypothetical protein